MGHSLTSSFSSEVRKQLKETLSRMQRDHKSSAEELSVNVTLNDKASEVVRTKQTIAFKNSQTSCNMNTNGAWEQLTWT
ncbi:hypothetical protein scyTo_0000976 [Scyliorhinus torazame]|uniref:Uncharacterized protein n=1 Tax=Scyliorhinus torazame TaxID=75743 RepID=A0A401P761_SCYTO|nr:hypothetical protein [Scyliorhinus torazame]